MTSFDENFRLKKINKDKKHPTKDRGDHRTPRSSSSPKNRDSPTMYDKTRDWRTIATTMATQIEKTPFL